MVRDGQHNMEGAEISEACFFKNFSTDRGTEIYRLFHATICLPLSE
jgi:hypothetical protein